MSRTMQLAIILAMSCALLFCQMMNSRGHHAQRSHPERLTGLTCSFVAAAHIYFHLLMVIHLGGFFSHPVPRFKSR